MTGSKIYGIPSKNSDIDLVVFVSDEELEMLRQEADEDVSRNQEADEHYQELGSVSLRFGKLNLLCCTKEKVYEVWKRGTFRLKRQSPVSRAFACRLMDTLRQEAGIGEPETHKESKSPKTEGIKNNFQSSDEREDLDSWQGNYDKDSDDIPF